MFGASGRGGSPRFRRGDLVEVRSEAEILATLDADGKLEGLPWMGEMLAFCGRQLRVRRRAEKVFLDYHWYVGRLKNTVLLEGPRCNGAAHAGCQLGCVLLWNEAWLKPAGQAAHPGGNEPDGEQAAPAAAVELPAGQGEPFCCQATELVRATTRLPWWDVRQYVRDLVSGDWSPREVARMVFLLGYNKIRRMRGRGPYGAVAGEQKTTAAGGLDLQPDQWVEVKSKAEIEATLDASGRNRGLGFSPEMAEFCGRRFRVDRRIERMILEWSGQMRAIRDTVILEGVTCDGISHRGCPRDCYHLWREIWLTRIDSPE